MKTGETLDEIVHYLKYGYTASTYVGRHISCLTRCGLYVYMLIHDERGVTCLTCLALNPPREW